ncbi:MAG: glycine cleavage T C-terminal barrel domain-containing protein [Phycisphaerales bacterium]
MAYPTPLRDLFEHADARWEPYGPPPERPVPDAGTPLTHARSPIEVAGQFDQIDIEYAAIRKASALLDLPHRGTLIFTGADRVAFLNRMVTQELKDAGSKPFTSRRAFWLNRKGRIDADLRLIILEDRILADVDAFAAPHARQSLDAYVIADDVAIEDATQRFHRLSLQGPGGPAVLASFAKPVAGGGVAVADIKPGEVSVIDIDGYQIIVDRWDSAGEIGLELTLEPAAAAPVFQRLLEAAHRNAPGHAGPNPRPQLRPIGWHAYNIARIEAGTPLFMLDFGPDALPAESGVLNDRVSFKKGCYLGQEIVARMNALGHPKQTLVGLKFEPSPDAPLLPLAGAPVFLDPLPTDKQPEPIGTVASATASPMLSGTPIAFAMVKFKQTTAGTKVHVPCLEHPEAQPVLRPATVQPSLAFWSRIAPV